MRWLLLSVLLLVPVDAWAATEQSAERNYASRLDEENLRFLRELSQLVRQQGFRDVQIIPQQSAPSSGPAVREHDDTLAGSTPTNLHRVGGMAFLQVARGLVGDLLSIAEAAIDAVHDDVEAVARAKDSVLHGPSYLKRDQRPSRLS